jgi:hypothetical protein
MKKTLFLIGLSAVSGLAAAQVLVSDAFNYSGALTSNGWAAHSGAGAKVVMANGTYATLNQSSGSGEDVNLSFAAQGATDVTYAAFDVLIEAANLGAMSANGNYFFHLKDSGVSAFRARTGIVGPSAGGGFRMAINADNANLGAGAQSGDLAFDTWYRVVINWNAATGESRLWLNPTQESDPFLSHTSGATAGLAISSVALRQSADYTGFQRIDNVVVGQSFADVQPVPEPASIAALGLGAVALLRRRKKNA